MRGADPIIKVGHHFCYKCITKFNLKGLFFADLTHPSNSAQRLLLCIRSFHILRSFQLLDEDEEVAEELAISKWNTDSVEEFLDTVMVKNEDAEIDISENLI